MRLFDRLPEGRRLLASCRFVGPEVYAFRWLAYGGGPLSYVPGKHIWVCLGACRVHKCRRLRMWFALRDERVYEVELAGPLARNGPPTRIVYLRRYMSPTGTQHTRYQVKYLGWLPAEVPGLAPRPAADCPGPLDDH